MTRFLVYLQMHGLCSDTHSYLQVEFLQGPAVGLSHKLSCSGDVGLGYEESTQPHMEGLHTYTEEYSIYITHTAATYIHTHIEPSQVT